VFNPYPGRYEDGDESSIRVVPVARGVTCNNGARLFVTALELWPDFSVVHWAILRIDEPRAGYKRPHPDLIHPHLWMRDNLGNDFSGGGHIGTSGTGPFARSSLEFEPIPEDAKSVTIGLHPQPPWNDWNTPGDWIVIELPR
jgi:hypothetical protein